MQTVNRTDGDSKVNGRPAMTPCTECQRRKQKCSREWPCNHCKSRKVSHLCEFGPRSPKTKSDSPSPAEATSRLKRKNSADDLEDGALDSAQPSIDTDDGLRELGYLPGHESFNLGPVVKDSAKHSCTTKNPQAAVVDEVLHDVPPRHLMDNLIQNFLNSPNYQYYTVYPPLFLDDYAQWWIDRTDGKQLLPDFTSLLLRICSISTQHLASDLKKKLELELGETDQELTDRFHRAAEKLSKSFPPGAGGLAHMQEMFLAATWLKSEGRLVESWHHLGSIIREAQEQGLHAIKPSDGPVNFESEMKVRIWCLLYVWDWQMSNWLSRPLIINRKDCSFNPPNLSLESSSSMPSAPSPFTHIALQAQMAQNLSLNLPEPPRPVTPEYIKLVKKELDNWLASFSPAYRVKEPDISFDKEHPYIALQRHQLHCTAYTTMVYWLKPYMTNATDENTPPKEEELRALGMDHALKLIDTTRGLFDLGFPRNAKYHYAIFFIFNTAAILCSAVLHDKHHNLPRRSEALEAISTALYMLEQYSLITQAGKTSYGIFSKLITSMEPNDLNKIRSFSSSPAKKSKTQSKSTLEPSIIPQLPREPSLIKDNSDQPSSSSAELPTPEPGVNPGIAPPPPSTSADTATAVPAVATPNDQTSSPIQPEIELKDLPQMDLGMFEQVWDWEALNLDFAAE